MRYHPRPRALTLTCALLFVACSQAPLPTDDDPYAGGRTYLWEQHAAPGFTSQSLTPGVNTLQYETPIFAANSWGPVEKNRSNGEQQPGDGQPLTLAGQRSAQGYGVHAGSELRFRLQGTGGAQCHNFTADIGVDDEVGDRGSVVFQVFTDGTKVYDSGLLTGASATKRVNVGVVGKQELRLVVTDAGDGISYDHADWAEPRLDCATQSPRPGSLDTSWSPVATSGPQHTAVLTPDHQVLTGDIFARQPDGKLLTVTNGTGGKVEIRRIFPDGRPDPAYGSGGKVTSTLSFTATDVVLQPDGKLVVVGAGTGATGSADIALTRYTRQGTPDPSFGQNGQVLTDLTPLVPNPYPDRPPTDSAESADQVELGPNGTLLILGPRKTIYNIGPVGMMARYRPDGVLDSTFGTQGWTDVTYRYGGSLVPVFAVEKEGRVLLVQGGAYSSYAGAVVWRIPVDGGAGRQSVNFFMGAEGQESNPKDLVIQDDGKIVIGGDSIVSEGDRRATLVRLKVDLTLDPAFGTGGRVFFPTDSGVASVERLLVQPDGKLVAVGSSILRLWP